MKVFSSPLFKVFLGVSAGVAVLGATVGPADTTAATVTAASAFGWGSGVTAAAAPKIAQGFKGGFSTAKDTDSAWIDGGGTTSADDTAALKKQLADARAKLKAAKEK